MLPGEDVDPAKQQNKIILSSYKLRGIEAGNLAKLQWFQHVLLGGSAKPHFLVVYNFKRWLEIDQQKISDQLPYAGGAEHDGPTDAGNESDHSSPSRSGGGHQPAPGSPEHVERLATRTQNDGP